MSSPLPVIAPRRNSSGGKRRLSGGFLPGDVGLDENDDENERQEAAQAAVQKQLAKVKSPLKETPGRQERRLEGYGDAMKRFMDNKVNKKNAFLNAYNIDDMDRMIRDMDRNSTGGTIEIFQKGAMMLDAGSRIIAARVDALEMQQERLRRMIDRPGAKVDDPADEEEEEEGAKAGAVDLEGAPEWAEASVVEEMTALMAEAKKTASPADMHEIATQLNLSDAKATELFNFVQSKIVKPKKPKKPKRKNPTAYLETDPSKLNMDKHELGADADPFFYRTSALYGIKGARGLMVHSLDLGADGLTLVLDARDAEVASAAARAQAQVAAPPAPLPAAALVGLLPTLTKELRVATAFRQYWAERRPDGEPDDGEEEPEAELEPEPDPEPEPEPEPEPGPELEPELAAAPEVAPPALSSPGAHEFADDGADGWGDDGPGAADEPDERVAQSQGGLIGLVDAEGPASLIDDAGDELELDGGGLEGNGYQGGSSMAEQLARRRRNRAGAAAAGGAAGAGAGARKAKEPVTVDFSNAAALVLELEDAAALDTKGTTILTKTMLSKAKAAETLLKRDFQVQMAALETLFERPSKRIAYERHVQRQQRQAKRRTESLFPDADGSQALANGPSSSAEPGAASKGAADGVDAYGGDDGDDGNWPDEEGGWDIGGGDEQDGGAGAGPRAPAPAPIVPPAQIAVSSKEWP